MRLLFALVFAVVLAIPATASATANEDGLQAQITAAGGTNGGIWANTTGSPVYEVGRPNNRFVMDGFTRDPFAKDTFAAAPPFSRINFDNVNSDYSAKSSTLTAKWQNVPLPPGWVPSTGSDHTLVVRNGTGVGPEYMESWVTRLNPSNSHWTGEWGGGESLTTLTDSDGLKVWPYPYGTSASGIALYPGLVMLSDLQAGVIDHPLHFYVRVACGHKAPANRDDGKCWADPVEYGAKFKLPDTVDVDAIDSDSRWCAPSDNRTSTEATALGWDSVNLRCPMPAMAKMIAKAAQTHYWVATDQQGDGSSGPGITFETEMWDRPRVDNWAGVAAGNPYAEEYLGCDGIQRTGYGDAHAVTVQEGWEQDCGLLTAFKGFPYSQLYEA